MRLRMQSRPSLAARFAVVLAGTAMLSLGQGCTAAAPAQGVAPPEQAPADSAPTQPSGQCSASALDRLLDGIDAASQATIVLSASFLATKTDALTEETERRSGEFVVCGQGRERKVAILVRDFIDGAGRLERENRHFVFADGWLTEYVPAERRATARQLALPEEEYDPLRAGEGPIPLPVGQRRADLERGFAVEISPWPEEAGSLSVSEGATFTVTCMRPHAGTSAAKELAEAWVAWDDATRQPLAIHARAVDGSTTTVRLGGLLTNDAVTEASRALLAAPTLPDGTWTLDRRPKEPG